MSIRQSSTDLLALKLLSRRPSHYSWRSRWDDTGMVTGRCFRSKRLGVSCWTRGYACLQSVGVGHAIRPIAGLRAVSDEGGVFDVVVNVGGGLGAVRRQGNPSSRLWFGDHQRRKAVMSTPARQAPSYGHSSIHLRHHPSAFCIPVRQGPSSGTGSKGIVRFNPQAGHIRATVMHLVRLTALTLLDWQGI